VASIGLAFPCVISAVGLGSLNVESSLNQPLHATIELALDDETILSGVKVRLAGVDAFK
jgi:Tfp pilus assembly protein FimV